MDESAGRIKKIWGIPRWTLGILLLLVTVVMWTSSNFLASVSIDPTMSLSPLMQYQINVLK